MQKYLLKGGTVVSAQGREVADVLIEGEKIAKVATNIEDAEATVMDVSGKYLLPGLIDVHVHLREPGLIYKEDLNSGTLAALHGGVTTVFDMPNTVPPTVSQVLLDEKNALAIEKAQCDVGFYVLGTHENLSELKGMRGMVGVKVFLGASTGGHEADIALLEEICKEMAASGKIIAVHAEDGACITHLEQQYKENHDPSGHSKVRAVECAKIAVQQVCELAAKYPNTRLHLAHVTSQAELELVERYRTPNLSCEVTPHHLFLTTQDYARLGNKLKVNPPVREEQDRLALWEALKQGGIDIIATDHAPHTLAEKEQDYWQVPSGVPGLETTLPLLLNEVHKGGLTLEDVVKWTSQSPAELWGLNDKGAIREGMQADMAVVDLEQHTLIRGEKMMSKSKWTPFEGLDSKGAILHVFHRGIRKYTA